MGTRAEPCTYLRSRAKLNLWESGEERSEIKLAIESTLSSFSLSPSSLFLSLSFLSFSSLFPLTLLSYLLSLKVVVEKSAPPPAAMSVCAAGLHEEPLTVTLHQVSRKFAYAYINRRSQGNVWLYFSMGRKKGAGSLLVSLRSLINLVAASWKGKERKSGWQSLADTVGWLLLLVALVERFRKHSGFRASS